MEAFTKIQSIVAPLERDDVNTDAIIPAEYLKLITRSGFAEGLFKNWRYQDGDLMQPEPTFVLNQPRYQGASILLTGQNFGCGSSREHAPWALYEYGFRTIIASSFADIFYNNCCNIGILPLRLERSLVQSLFAEVATTKSYVLTIDLATQSVVTPSGHVLPFAIEDFRKEALLLGLDAVGSTLLQQKQIAAYEQRMLATPWYFDLTLPR